MRKSFSANKSVVTEISPEFGLLEKKGKGVIFTSWKKRKFSFSLKDKCLKYFDMKDNLRGALILDDQHEASIVDPIHVNGKEFTFEIFGTKSHPTRGIHIERYFFSYTHFRIPFDLRFLFVAKFFQPQAITSGHNG